MKRGVTAISVLLLSAMVLAVACFVTESGNPQFQPARTLPAIPSNSIVSYDFLAHRPFEGGRVWVTTRSGTNRAHCYLLDIEGKKILGELTGAGPVFLSADLSRVLCMRRVPRGNPIRLVVARFLERITSGKIQLGQRDDAETFWLVDLQRHTSRKVGELFQTPGAGTSFMPSPDFRYGFNKPTVSLQKP